MILFLVAITHHVDLCLDVWVDGWKDVLHSNTMSYKYILKVALNCNITGGLTDGHSVFVDELRFTGACKFRYCFNIKLIKVFFLWKWSNLSYIYVLLRSMLAFLEQVKFAYWMNYNIWFSNLWFYCLYKFAFLNFCKNK